MNTDKKKSKKKLCIALLAAVLILCIAGVLTVNMLGRPKRIELPEPDIGQEKPAGEFKKAVIGSGLELGAENEGFKLYFDNETGGVAVEDKNTGKITYSSPLKSLEDPKASDTVKKQIYSPIKLNYYMISKKTEDEMNSYESAILLDQVSWAKTEDGIRVAMTIGREEQRRLLPKQISKDSLDNVISKITSDRTVKQIKAFYILYTLEGVDEVKKKELLEKYPILETTDIYVLKTSATDRDKSLLEDGFKTAGYTQELLAEEYERIDFNDKDEVFPSFKLSIDYTLSGNSLEVDLNTANIIYDNSNFYLTNISLLNFFGAGETGQEGYIFLPDGSGTLINFNNDGTKRTMLTKGKVYGPDGAELIGDRGSFKNEFRLPVFGVKTGDQAILGVIHQGDAIAEINCELGNINHSYNAAYANFVISRKELYVEKGAFEQTPWVMYDKKGYKGRIALKYYFLSGEDADYVGMAKAYRAYLLEEEMISESEVQENIPFIMETIGSVKNPVKRLGIPVVSDVAITSFDNAYNMLEELTQLGIHNIKLRYTAWYNGGYYRSAASEMNVVKTLGGKKGLKKLNQKAEELGVKIYPDVNFLTHDSDEKFDGFSSSKDGVRTLFQKLGFYPELAVATLTTEDWYYCVNPNSMLGYFDNFTKDYNKLSIPNISLGTAGKILNSNYKNSDYVNRQTSERITEELLSRASEKYDEIMIEYGNSYALPNADYILKFPSEDSSYLIADKSVPFAQIALHGFIQYADQPLNTSSNIEKDVLKCIEYGEVPYFMLCRQDSSILKQAFIFDAIYSVNFENWKQKAADIYNKINDALKDVQNVPIADHQELEKDVYLVTYENGLSIAVNYSDKAAEVNGVTVAPADYAVIRQMGGNN